MHRTREMKKIVERTFLCCTFVGATRNFARFLDKRVTSSSRLGRKAVELTNTLAIFPSDAPLMAAQRGPMFRARSKC